MNRLPEIIWQNINPLSYLTHRFGVCLVAIAEIKKFDHSPKNDH